MKKRTALFKVLMRRFVNSTTFFFGIWAAFVIVNAIIGFNIFKTEPIPLTQDEIKYYTNQAELGYHKGIKYLDDTIMFIPKDSTTATIYTDGQPNVKQRLEVTYLNNEIVSAEPYYPYGFLGDRIAGATLLAFCGFLEFILIAVLLELISKKIISIKKEIKKELEEELKKANSVTDEKD